jgi:hypothetical protein
MAGGKAVKNFGQAVDTFIAAAIGELGAEAETPEETQLAVVAMLQFEARVFATLDPFALPH